LQNNWENISWIITAKIWRRVQSFTYFVDYFFELPQFLLTFYDFCFHLKFFIFDPFHLNKRKAN
jgi:hypothetical protein